MELSSNYQVIFSGELNPGVTSEEAKVAVAKLFKATPAKIAVFFSGESLVIKSGLSYERALEYQKALSVVGVIAYVRPVAHQARELLAHKETIASTAMPQQAKVDDVFTIAHLGVNMSQVTEVEPFDIDLSHLKLLELGADLLEVYPEFQVRFIDTSHLSLL